MLYFSKIKILAIYIIIIFLATCAALNLINNKEIDIVYIALPHNFHFEWINKCIDSKKNIQWAATKNPININFIIVIRFNLYCILNKKLNINNPKREMSIL